MSTQHSQNKNTTKKIKLDEVNENVCSIAEYKRCAILKYYNGNDSIFNQLNELFISDDFHKLGMCYCLHLSISNIVLFNFTNFSMVLIEVKILYLY